MENVSEILWVIVRSLSRDIENFPMSVSDVECQVIPFWTGYNSSLSEYRSEYSVVSYAPLCTTQRKLIATVRIRLHILMAMPYSTIKLFPVIICSTDPAAYREDSFNRSFNPLSRRCQGMTKSLGQAYSIQTFDQQLYAIVKQVEWAKQDTFKAHILWLGGFHTMS
jgi:hypothetical protein